MVGSSSSLTLEQQCNGTIGGWRQVVTQQLATTMLRRRTWSLHRHVHLVQAFEDARRRAEQPIRSALTVGCGGGISELYLAARYPDITFTLTDVDAVRLKGAQRSGWKRGLRNVRYRELNILEPPDDEQFDFVSSTEVIEHIEDDRKAAANMVRLSKGFVYILVPYATERWLHDDAKVKRGWEVHQHFRPGYTHDGLASLVDDADIVWLYNTYFAPEAGALRERLDRETNRELREHRAELIALALRDVREATVSETDTSAAGVKVLAKIPT